MERQAHRARLSRTLTPLLQPCNPYGTFRLDMNERLRLEA